MKLKKSKGELNVRTIDSGTDSGLGESESGGVPASFPESGEGSEGEEGEGGGSRTFIDPHTFEGGEREERIGEVSEGAESGGGKKRGRPKGSGAKASGTKKTSIPTAIEVDGIGEILLSIHEMLAAFTQVEELSMSEQEAQSIAKHITRVTSLYDLRASNKAVAWTGLAMCLGKVYGPRIAAYHLRTSSEKKGKVVEISAQRGS